MTPLPVRLYHTFPCARKAAHENTRALILHVTDRFVGAICRRDGANSSIHKHSPSHLLERSVKWPLQCWRVSIETHVYFCKCRINTENRPTKVVIINNATKCWSSFPSGSVGRSVSNQLTCWQAQKWLLSHLWLLSSHLRDVFSFYVLSQWEWISDNIPEEWSRGERMSGDSARNSSKPVRRKKTKLAEINLEHTSECEVLYGQQQWHLKPAVLVIITEAANKHLVVFFSVQKLHREVLF